MNSSTKEKRPSHFSTGMVGSVIGLSFKSAGHMMDRHRDLSYRVGRDRRIVRDNLARMLEREGITTAHLGWHSSPRLFWIGRPIDFCSTLDDMAGTVLECVSAILAGKVGKVFCTECLSETDINELSDICLTRGVRFTAIAPDDANPRKPTPNVWIWRGDGTTSVESVMKWIRGVE